MPISYIHSGKFCSSNKTVLEEITVVICLSKNLEIVFGFLIGTGHAMPDHEPYAFDDFLLSMSFAAILKCRLSCCSEKDFILMKIILVINDFNGFHLQAFLKCFNSHN